jgi:hypothetical protein
VSKPSFTKPASVSTQKSADPASGSPGKPSLLTRVLAILVLVVVATVAIRLVVGLVAGLVSGRLVDPRRRGVGSGGAVGAVDTENPPSAVAA